MPVVARLGGRRADSRAVRNVAAGSDSELGALLAGQPSHRPGGWHAAGGRAVLRDAVRGPCHRDPKGTPPALRGPEPPVRHREAELSWPPNPAPTPAQPP